MKLSYQSGNLELSVCLDTVLQTLSDEQKVLLVDSLSCEEAIIKNVADQILTGWTEQCSHGRTSYTSQSDPECLTALDRARRELARNSSEIAAKEIARLEDALKYREKELQDERTDRCVAGLY